MNQHKPAVIFIHGILETPKQFRKLVSIAVQEGYLTYNILLPGHGGSDQYFARTSYMKWVQCVTIEINKILLNHEKLIIVGHSMGALLAICETVARKHQITALFLIDPPIKIHIWPRVIKGALKIKRGCIKSDEKYTLAEYHAMGVWPMRNKAMLGWALRYSELMSIIWYTKKLIPYIRCNLFLVFAAKDEFVSKCSMKYFDSCLGKVEQLYLKDSGHFCYHHSDLIILEERFKQYINRIKEL